MVGRVSICCSLVLATLCTSALAWGQQPLAVAEPTLEQGTAQTGIESARALFRDAVALAREGKFEAARDALLASSKLHPHAATYYNLALSELESSAPRDTPTDSSQHAAAAHAAAIQSRRTDALFHLDLALARQLHANELAPETARAAEQAHTSHSARFARVDVTLTTPGATLESPHHCLQWLEWASVPRAVFVSRELGCSSMATPTRFVLLLDAGRHTLGLSSNGESSSLQLEVTAAETRQLGEADFSRGAGSSAPAIQAPARASVPRATLPVLRATSKAVPRVQASANTPSSQPTRDVPRSASKSNAVLWASFGSSALGLATFAVFGGLALDRASKLEERCPSGTRCPWGTARARQDLARLALVADVGLLLGVAGGVTGAWVIWTRDDSDVSSAQWVVSGTF